MTIDLCPCGSQKNYAACCGLFISGEHLPATPEQLMRSRYTAYTQANIDYIANTMRGPAALHFDANVTLEWMERVEWLKLDVVKASGDSAEGYVEFIAHFMRNNARQVLHELSEFHCIEGKWYYIDGKDLEERTPLTVTHIGRNDPCSCGSGKKYKKCCGILVK